MPTFPYFNYGYTEEELDYLNNRPASTPQPTVSTPPLSGKEVTSCKEDKDPLGFQKIAANIIRSECSSATLLAGIVTALNAAYDKGRDHGRNNIYPKRF